MTLLVQASMLLQSEQDSRTLSTHSAWIGITILEQDDDAKESYLQKLVCHILISLLLLKQLLRQLLDQALQGLALVLLTGKLLHSCLLGLYVHTQQCETCNIRVQQCCGHLSFLVIQHQTFRQLAQRFGHVGVWALHSSVAMML